MLGLPAVVAVDLIARGFFALKDTHTPFVIGLFSFVTAAHRLNVDRAWQRQYRCLRH
ncbi:MAG: hypothetical protein JO202_02365 [Ktedonobacteraceae bacterium]|nr:hypothetical protein [Ktedonobacteraceae bacterium]